MALCSKKKALSLDKYLPCLTAVFANSTGQVGHILGCAAATRIKTRTQVLYNKGFLVTSLKDQRSNWSVNACMSFSINPMTGYEKI